MSSSQNFYSTFNGKFNNDNSLVERKDKERKEQLLSHAFELGYDAKGGVRVTYQDSPIKHDLLTSTISTN